MQLAGRACCAPAPGTLAFLLFLVTQGLAAEPTLVTVNEAARPAKLESATDTEVRFVEDNQAKTLSANDIITWGTPREADRPQVILVDGSVLVAEIASIQDEKVTVISPTFGELELPLSGLSVCLLHPPTDPWRRDALRARLVSAPGESDRLVLANGDELRGTIGSCDDEVVRFDAEIGAGNSNTVEVPLTNVAAIVFNPALRARTAASTRRTWLGLDDGSLLLASKWTLEAGKLTLARDGDMTWASNRAAAAEPVAFFQPLDGAARYLSDLEPEAYRHIPYLGREWPYRLDRTVSGANLRVGGRLYVKGVGMHSASRLTFPLGGEYAKFAAEIAIDDETKGGGSVVFRVFADAEERYRSPIIRGGDAPTAISVPIAGAAKLSLVVDHAERGDQLDRADWLNARVVK